MSLPTERVGSSIDPTNLFRKDSWSNVAFRLSILELLPTSTPKINAHVGTRTTDVQLKWQWLSPGNDRKLHVRDQRARLQDAGKRHGKSPAPMSLVSLFQNDVN